MLKSCQNTAGKKRLHTCIQNKTEEDFVKVSSDLSKEGYSFLNFITAVFKNRKISWDATWNEARNDKNIKFSVFFLFFSYCKICGAPEGLISIWIPFSFTKKCYKFPEFKWDGVRTTEQYYYHCCRASSSSVVRVSELELGGSWVRFSPGAQIIFSELSGLRILLLPNYHFIIIIWYHILLVVYSSRK